MIFPFHRPFSSTLHPVTNPLLLSFLPLSLFLPFFLFISSLPTLSLTLHSVTNPPYLLFLPFSIFPFLFALDPFFNSPFRHQSFIFLLSLFPFPPFYRLSLTLHSITIPSYLSVSPSYVAFYLFLCRLYLTLLFVTNSSPFSFLTFPLLLFFFSLLYRFFP